jgi:hypothetical protein
MVATEETSPTAAAATQRLLRYWAHGEGAVKLQPGAEGSWDRCHALLGKYIQGRQLDGFCARVIHEATGHWPGEHHKDKG